MGEPERNTKPAIKPPLRVRFSLISSSEETWHPPTDVFETSGELVVKIELPGVDIENVHAVLEGKQLIVQGVRRDPCGNEKVAYHRMEISYGPFRKVIRLPLAVETEKMKTVYREGFLEITLPFSREPLRENAEATAK